MLRVLYISNKISERTFWNVAQRIKGKGVTGGNE